ncbi:unnamed protein product, partial [marine sediment metagenome]
MREPERLALPGQSQKHFTRLQALTVNSFFQIEQIFSKLPF